MVLRLSRVELDPGVLLWSRSSMVHYLCRNGRMGYRTDTSRAPAPQRQSVARNNIVKEREDAGRDKPRRGRDDAERPEVWTGDEIDCSLPAPVLMMARANDGVSRPFDISSGSSLPPSVWSIA